MNNSLERYHNISITEIVESYSIQVRARKAKCPFHDDRTPSMSVSEDKGLWYCHVCAKGGDQIKFIQLIENRGFTQALAFLDKQFNGIDWNNAYPYGGYRKNSFREVIEENKKEIKSALEEEKDRLRFQLNAFDTIPKRLWPTHWFTFAEYIHPERCEQIDETLRMLDNVRNFVPGADKK